MPYKDRKAQLEFQRNHYKENKPQYQSSSRRAALRREAAIRALKCGPCADCGKQYPTCVMDFDHRDSATKLGDVAAMIKRAKLLRVIEEIGKCDLVCANCHRLRSHSRGQHQNCILP